MSIGRTAIEATVSEAPDQREGAEGERRGEQGQEERQQPRAPEEHQPQRARHHDQDGDQQQLDRAA